MIYLVHHGDAVGPEVDPQRPLSLRGRTHVDELALRAKAHDVLPAAIWHSGKLRARQTAEAFWRTCNPLAEFAAIRGLQPTDPPQWIKDLITGEPRDLMFVGHMPSLPRILAALTGSEDFPQHGLVALEVAEAGGWVERFRLP